MKVNQFQQKLEKKEVVTVGAMARVRQFVYDYVNISASFGPAIDSLEFTTNMKMMYPEYFEDSLSKVAIMRLVDDSGENPTIHTGYAAINYRDHRTMGIITKMRRKNNNKGWVVFFSLVGNTKTVEVKTYVRGLDKICLTINETNNGVKFLWFVNKKPCWNVDGTLGGHLYGFEHVIWRGIIKDIESIYSIDKFVPIAKYLPLSLEGHGMSVLDTVYGLNKYDINILSYGTNVKDILNRIYGRNGQLGLTKNAFGGLHRMSTLNELLNAAYIVKLFKGCPAPFFEKIDQLIRQHVEYLNYPSIKHMFKHMNYFLKYFNRPKIQQEILEHLDKVAQRHVTPEGTATYIDAMLNLMVDSGRMLRGIRNRTVRNNIFEFRGSIEEIHDLIVSEYNKIKQENRKIKYAENVSVLNGQRIENRIECVLPYDTHTLIEWGSAQHNCIGSYADRVLEKHSLIVGFRDIETNEWIGHAEIVKRPDNKWNQITQLLGSHNAPLNKLDDLVIRKFIKDWVNSNKKDN